MSYDPETASRNDHTQMFDKSLYNSGTHNDSGTGSIQSGRSERCAVECFGVSDEYKMGSRYSETARREDVLCSRCSENVKESNYTDSRGSGGFRSEYSYDTRGLDGSYHRSLGGPNIGNFDGSVGPGGLSGSGRAGFNRPDPEDLRSSGRIDSNVSNKQTKIKENNGSDGSTSEYSCDSRCGGSCIRGLDSLGHRSSGGPNIGNFNGSVGPGGSGGSGGFNRPDPEDLRSSGRKDSTVSNKETKIKEINKDMVPHPHCCRCCAHPCGNCKVPKSSYYIPPPRCFPSCCMQSYFRSPFCKNNCCPMSIRCIHLHYTLYRGNEQPPSALAALNIDPKLKALI